MSQANSATKLPDAAVTTSLVVNGERHDTEATTLDGLLAELGYSGRKIATARNGEFVPETARAATALVTGDRIEIVAPRQGG